MDETHVSIEQLIQTALSNTHREPELLKNRDELFTADLLADTLYKIAKGFDKSRKSTYKLYLQNLRSGNSDVSLLTTYKLFDLCYKYYEEEYNIVIHMLYEFYFYAFHGYWVRTLLFNYEREERNLYDFISAKFGRIVQTKDDIDD